MSVQKESKRIKQFRLGVAKSIPKFPNNLQTLTLLEEKSLGSLLIDYINWASRLIAPRPRKVIIEPTLTVDPRWKTLSVDTNVLFERVRKGDDLNQNLSLRALRNGFTPASSSPAPNTDRWEDKDFLLNIMGYHHLHLSQIVEAGGYVKRTDDVLFAHITRSEFYAIGFFDHSVFDFTDQISKTMTIERERLWRIYDQRNSIGRESGQVYISNPITTSGHSLQHTSLATYFARLIYSIDPKLDDLASRAEIFNTVPHNILKAMKLKWHLNYLDLGLLDVTTSNFYVLKYGTL